MTRPKFIPLSERHAYHRLEDIIGCKWSTAQLRDLNAAIEKETLPPAST
jgi:hypothetical protein